jgi:3-dehydroquinate dehydratase-2
LRGIGVKLAPIFQKLASEEIPVANLLLLSGPNLNMLGTREPGLYGSSSLDEIEQDLQARAAARHCQLTCFRSNAEHELVERVQAAGSDGSDVLIINPAALGHTSIALRDALLGCAKPFIEIHISNIFAREPFRHHSYLSDVAAGCIVGLGTYGYRLALDAAINLSTDTGG